MLILWYKFGNHDSAAKAPKPENAIYPNLKQSIHPRHLFIYQKEKIERGMVSVRFVGIHYIACPSRNVPLYSAIPFLNLKVALKGWS